MNKKKIIILAISAAVVIAGAIAAVVLLRDFNVKEDTSTTQSGFDKIIKVDDSYDYLLRIPIGSITKEGLEKLKKDITENKELYKLYKDKDYKEFWIDDLKELKSFLK